MSGWLHGRWLVFTMVFGCSSTGVGNPLTASEQSLLVLGEDATSAGDTASSLVSVPIVALSDTASLTVAEDLSSGAETRTPLYYQPKGCLVTTRNGATVTFDFQGCRTGALGVGAEVHGQLVAAYTLTPGSEMGVTISTPSTLTLALVPVTLTAETSFTANGTTRSLVWSGAYHADRLLRPPIDHEASYQAMYDTSTQCLSLSGSATTTLATGDGVESVLSDYVRCGTRTACPQSGMLTLTRLPNRTESIVVDYTGGPSVRVRVPQRGVDVQVALACDG